MSKNPHKYFVGEVTKKNGKKRNRVLRQRWIGRIFERLVVESRHRDWQVFKGRFVRKSKLFDSRYAAERAKLEMEEGA